MTDITKQENEELLTPADDDQAVEAELEPQYDPREEGAVVTLEPAVITIGRAKRAEALRKMRDESRNS